MSAFCFSSETIDFQLLQLWLRGLSVSQAAPLRDDYEQHLKDVVEFDTVDHFRLFEQLQPILEEPNSSETLIELPAHVQRQLSEQFYSFDDIVVREFLGRKFTARAKKDWLDEVSESTGIARRSCLRQFDNLRR